MQISPRIPPAGPVMETFAAPSSKTMHPSASPNPNCGLTHFPTLVAEVTTRVMEQSVWSPACSPLLSVAVKVITYVPASAAVGVQEKVLLTGLPLVGKRGVMVAPAGNPATFKVTLCPGSGSDAWTVKLRVVPTFTGVGVGAPHTGADEGLLKTGGLPPATRTS